MDSELQTRLEQMSETSDSTDWNDVLTRAARVRSQSSSSQRGSRFLRPWTMIAATCILAASIVAPAVALRVDIFSFSAGEKAPSTIQKDFDTLDVGAPPGMAPGVISAARKVLAIQASDGAHALWVAPTRDGGFCVQIDRLGGGCDRDRQLDVAVSLGRRSMETPVLIWGSVLNRDAHAIALEYQDGESTTLSLTGVTSPIDAGFFLFELPRMRERDGRRPIAAVARDAHGQPLASENIFTGVMFGEAPAKTSG